MKTYMANNNTTNQKWFIVDATDRVLGRLATRIAILLRGKHKPEYTPHVDCGDGVIVINVSKIRVTGKKMQDKEYVTYSGYPGGRRVRKMDTMMERHPDKIMRQAVKRMIPDTPLGRQMLKKLKIYANAEHSHEAQQPRELKV